jgi:hypothetical protein
LQFGIPDASAAPLGWGEAAPPDFPLAHALNATSTNPISAALRLLMALRFHAIARRNPLALGAARGWVEATAQVRRRVRYVPRSPRPRRTAMFDAIKNVAAQMMSGNVNSAAVGEAVSNHLDSVGSDGLADHLQNAASNLQDNGQAGDAQQVAALVEQIRSNPAGAKDAVVAFIQGNPQLLQHFSPEFVQGIASKLGL